MFEGWVTACISEVTKVLAVPWGQRAACQQAPYIIVQGSISPMERAREMACWRLTTPIFWAAF